MPDLFQEFIFGEPVASIGTTFCLWNEGDGWKIGDVTDFDDNSGKMLKIFNGNSQAYIDYASEYFEEGYKAGGLPADVVSGIYNGTTLTKEWFCQLSTISPTGNSLSKTWKK